MREWERVLELPVLGAMDSKRADQALESLLQAVVAEQARCVLLDITGVDLVDTQTIGVDLSSVVTLRNMQDGLRYCMDLLGRRPAGAGPPGMTPRRDG